MFENEPIVILPKKLQSKKKKLLEQKRKIEAEIEKINKQIKEKRYNCKHKAVPGTENHYATYCMLCGHMMDTWL